jgi:hypothetical protein
MLRFAKSWAFLSAFQVEKERRRRREKNINMKYKNQVLKNAGQHYSK